MQRNFVSSGGAALSVLEESAGGMGCLYNEVRRGLFLTMEEAKGGSCGFVGSRDEAAEPEDVTRGFCALDWGRYSGGKGGGYKEEQKNNYFQLADSHPLPRSGTTRRHLQSQHQISGLL